MPRPVPEGEHARDDRLPGSNVTSLHAPSLAKSRIVATSPGCPTARDAPREPHPSPVRRARLTARVSRSKDEGAARPIPWPRSPRRRSSRQTRAGRADARCDRRGDGRGTVVDRAFEANGFSDETVGASSVRTINRALERTLSALKRPCLARLAIAHTLASRDASPRPRVALVTLEMAHATDDAGLTEYERQRLARRAIASTWRASACSPSRERSGTRTPRPPSRRGAPRA